MKDPHLLSLEIITRLSVPRASLQLGSQAGLCSKKNPFPTRWAGRVLQIPLQLGGQMGSCSSSRAPHAFGWAGGLLQPPNPPAFGWAGGLLQPPNPHAFGWAGGLPEPPPRRCPAAPPAPRRRGLPIPLRSSLLHRFKRVVFGDCVAKRALNFHRRPFQSLL